MIAMFLQQSKTNQIWIKLLYKLTTQWTHFDNNIRVTKSMINTQELGFLDRQNYQLCFQHWIRTLQNRKNPARKDTRLPFTSGAFWTYGLKMENQYCEPNLGH